MNQFLIAIVITLGLGCYFLYSQNATLTANNIKLESAIAEQEAAIEALQQDFKLQTEQLQVMTEKSQAAQRELNRYTQFIQNYKLTAKVLENPTEMERKINNGTKHIFEDIEKLSDTVDNLDDGLQLQPNPN